MAHLGGNVVPRELYFPDALTDAVSGGPRTANVHRDRDEGDSITRRRKRSTLKLVRGGAAYRGSIAMGVQRT